MNPASHDRLKSAAQGGDIEDLYSVIGENPHVLEEIDSIPFVETPLHVAASAGHHQFAIELMSLKPSFALKLNPQGLSPIHLALEPQELQDNERLVQDKERLVLRLVDINKDLIRVKGKEGLTPLHFVSKRGLTVLLTKFLEICPDSIKDVTVKNESALHIAVRHRQYGALKVLVESLMRNLKIDEETERRILNLKDEVGNTILHVSVQAPDEPNVEIVKLLVKTKVDLDAENDVGSSALAIANTDAIRNILETARANSSVLRNIPDLNITWMDRINTFLRRITCNIPEEKRNNYLIIATLIITATYQSALSPPGGVYQANSGDNNAINATNSLNSTAIPTQGNEAGTSVLPGSVFAYLSIINLVCVVVSAMTILILIPRGNIGRILIILTLSLVVSYIFSMFVISPTVVMHIFFLVIFGIVGCLLYPLFR